MKSKFFKDTQGLEHGFEPSAPDRVSVCVRLSRPACARIMEEAGRLNVTSGEYLDRLILGEAQEPPRLH